MTPTQFNALKRDIIERLVDEMPDEALGELIDTLREMLTHYGSKAQQEQELGSAATVPNRNELVALLKQREAAAKKIETEPTFALDHIESDEKETAQVEMDTRPFVKSMIEEEVADADTRAKEAEKAAAAAAYTKRVRDLKAAKQAAREAAQRKQAAEQGNAEKPHSITHRGSLLARLEEARKKTAGHGG